MVTDGPAPEQAGTPPPTGEKRGLFGRLKRQAPAPAEKQTPPPTQEALPEKMGKMITGLKKKDQELDGGLITELGQKDGPLTLQRPIDTTDDTSDARRYTVVHDYLIVTKDGFKVLRADTAMNTGNVKKFIDSWIQEGSYSPWADVTKDLGQAINSNDKTKLGGYMAKLIENPKQEEVAKIIQTNVEAAKTAKDQKDAEKLAEEAKKIAGAEEAQRPQIEKDNQEEARKKRAEEQVIAQSKAADSTLDLLGKL